MRVSVCVWVQICWWLCEFIDPFCHPVFGNSVTSPNFLLKVTKKRCVCVCVCACVCVCVCVCVRVCVGKVRMRVSECVCGCKFVGGCASPLILFVILCLVIV